MQLAAKSRFLRLPRPAPTSRRSCRVWTVALAVAVVSAGACGSSAPSEESTITGPVAPDAIVGALFEHLAAGDYNATASLVDEGQIALLTAIEGADPAEVATMLERGLPDHVRVDFWEGFVSSLPLMVEESVDRAQVGDVEDLGGGFFAVSVAFPGAEQPVGWIVRTDDAGRSVDLFATFGPAFAPNLANWYGALPPGPARDTIRRALLDRTTSLQVGLEAEPLGPWGDGARTGVAELLSTLAA